MKRPGSKSWLMSVVPGASWQLIFLALPLLAIFVVSFLSRGDYGDVQRPFTLGNYKQLAGYGPLGFEPLYPLILARTLALALATTLLCAAAALPLAFFCASLAGRRRTAALILLTVPAWTNLLVRTYAWQILLGAKGPVALVLAKLGLIAPGTALYPSTGAVLLCLMCDYLPFAALPLYASVEKLDHSLVEAAKDLGASRWNAFRHGIYPQIKPGLWAGVIFVFLPSLGQFVIPDLLGGARTALLGNILQQQFGTSRDWPFGSAIAVFSILFIIAAVLMYSRKKSDSGFPIEGP
jgi:spermidine/putrescine transport system permease protein